MAYIMTRPMPWLGTEEARRKNVESHNFQDFWYGEDDCETRCMDCDCRPSHVAADYPCGEEPPREEVIA